MDAKQERKEQWKAGIVGLSVLLMLALIMPAAGGFADWYNELNANHASADAIFSEIVANSDETSDYDMDGATETRFSTNTTPNTFWYFYNGTGTDADWNKCNVTAYVPGTGYTVATTSTAGNPRDENVNESGQLWPYWVINFDYRAWDAYYENAVRIIINLSLLDTGNADGGATLGAYEQTITLYWGDTIFYTANLESADSTFSEPIDLDLNELREAVMTYGQTGGYLKLKIEKQGFELIIDDCSVNSYSATNLVSRDAALGLGLAFIGAIGFIGALAVQPGISLTDLMQRGPRGKGRGR